MIIGYRVSCTDGFGSVVHTLNTANFVEVVGGLNPYSFYTCSVTASTRAGNGPTTTLNFTTAIDGEYQ